MELDHHNQMNPNLLLPGSSSQQPSPNLADERFMRQVALSESPTGLPGVATEDERTYYYHLSKKGIGFSPELRRQVWHDGLGWE